MVSTILYSMWIIFVIAFSSTVGAYVGCKITDWQFERKRRIDERTRNDHELNDREWDLFVDNWRLERAERHARWIREEREEDRIEYAGLIDDIRTGRTPRSILRSNTHEYDKVNWKREGF